MNDFCSLRKRWRSASGRSRLVVKNITLSLVLRCVSILSSLLIVPMTIHYIDATQYGIWLTISSIVAWANFFDLGLANGFRNRFAEAKAMGNDVLAQQYVSTTYCVISCVIAMLLVAILLINSHLDWPKILNVDSAYYGTLQTVFMILSIFFCMNMVANIFVKLLEADQHPAIGALISCIGQVLSLGSIYLLTKFTEGSLVNLSLYFSSIPFFTMLVGSVIMFSFSRYRRYRPSFSAIRVDLIKNIMGLGLRFFVIYLCLIVVFHLMNIVLSREVGPFAVTQYSIANKYFSITYMVSAIVVGPMWSAFTDAYARDDYSWMRSTIKKMEIWMLIASGISAILLVFSPWAYSIWIGKSVIIPFSLSIAVMLLIITQIGGNIFTTIICGLGHMRVQTLIYLLSALIAFPFMTFCCRQFGVIGITVFPTLVYACQSLACRTQVWKIIDRRAEGIWLK